MQQEVWLYAHNADTTARKLTVEFGGTTAPGDIIEQTIPAESGLTLVTHNLREFERVPGLRVERWDGA